MSQPTRALQCATRYSWCRIKERFKPVRLNISTIYIIFFSPTASDLFLVSLSELTKFYLQQFQFLHYSRQQVLATCYDCATLQETMVAEERIPGVNAAKLRAVHNAHADRQAAATHAQEARSNRGMRNPYSALNAVVAATTAGGSGQQPAQLQQ
jgi:hypothetical protein